MTTIINEMNARRFVNILLSVSWYVRDESKLTTRKNEQAPDRRFIAEWRSVKKAIEPKAAVRATRI
jgi:steroid 5-alpha reductase family enzyme